MEQIQSCIICSVGFSNGIEEKNIEKLTAGELKTQTGTKNKWSIWALDLDGVDT